MRIVILGGTGMVGQAFQKVLISREIEIITIGRRLSNIIFDFESQNGIDKIRNIKA